MFPTTSHIAPAYPFTRRGPHVDLYHGVQVADPYRWLEDATEDRQDWIARQNAATEQYLADTSLRDGLQARFKELLSYPRYYDFYRRGGRLLFAKNNGLQSQLVLYAQDGMAGTPRVLLDPHDFAADGTTRIAGFSASAEGTFLAYALSPAGSDWQEIRVLEIATGRQLSDRICWAKSLRPAWHGRGFYYSRYAAPEREAIALSAINENHEVWYHRLGSPQSEDRLAYSDAKHPHRIHLVQTTEDGRFIVLTIGDAALGTSGAAIALLSTEYPARVTRLVSSFEHQFRLVGSRGKELIFLTNHGATNRRVVAVDATQPERNALRVIVSESDRPIEHVVAACGKLFVVSRVHAAHRLTVFNYTGDAEAEIALPDPAHVTVFEGQEHDSEAIWSSMSFTLPPVIHRYDTRTRQSAPFIASPATIPRGAYDTTQVLYPSYDGTRIPMFVVHKRGITLDGSHPALVCGYGGGGICMGPTFDPLLYALLERGVIFALACLRGGGEYGRHWHDAGRRERKQTVFDDCIAGLEWLQAHSYTSRERTALIGSSNGGLLVGAVMTQRPDLLAVAVPSAGVMDMLRFQHFTMGHAWINEYGSSDDAALFPTLLAYSPLHRIREGVCYPATLVTTSQHDDRVVPAHSFKFIAALQACGAGKGPYLIRIDRHTGHGAVSLHKEIAERVDIYAFLLQHLCPELADVEP